LALSFILVLVHSAANLKLPLNFASIEKALKEAFKRIFSGAIVWKIEGPKGFHLDRAEIERQYGVFRTS
jgi:hypothetical protein